MKIPEMLRKPMSIMILSVLAFISVLGFIKYRQIAAAVAMHAQQGPPPEAITTIVAQEVNWKPVLEVVGSLAPSQGVTLSAEEPGKVVKIGFDSGASVKTGDLLVQMDTSVEEAKLKAADARAELAQINLKRMNSLRVKDAIAESELNNAVAQAKEAQGDVEEIRAIIARKTITAPFNGKAGIRMVNLGQYLPQGASVVPLHSLDPIFLDFSVPQQRLGDLSLGQTVQFSVDAFPAETFEGKITAVDPQIDDATRNVKVQATIANPQERMRPGMFAKVKILLGGEEKVIPIPATSISYAPYGNSVFVVENMKGPDGSEYQGVRQQFIHLGSARGDQVAIVSGVKIGDQVVTSGVFKLRPGAQIIINNSITPGNNPEPKPADT